VIKFTENYVSLEVFTAIVMKVFIVWEGLSRRIPEDGTLINKRVIIRWIVYLRMSCIITQQMEYTFLTIQFRERNYLKSYGTVIEKDILNKKKYVPAIATDCDSKNKSINLHSLYLLLTTQIVQDPQDLGCLWWNNFSNSMRYLLVILTKKNYVATRIEDFSSLLMRVMQLLQK
jgi:hypothetical protein